MNAEFPCDQVAAAEWVRANLNDPLAMELSRAVVRSVDLLSAAYSAFARSSLDLRAPYDFRHGGHADTSPSPDSMLVRFVERLPQPAFVVFEDWMARPSDEFLTRQGMPFQAIGQEVYYLFDTSEVGVHPAWRRACANYSPLFHGFIFSGVKPSKLDLNHLLHDRTLLALILGVFDGESYLVGKFPEQIASRSFSSTLGERNSTSWLSTR